MLKVVGASWEKTRLIYIILAIVIIIAIATIFFYEIPETIEDDGMYAATAYWKPQYGFTAKFWGQNNDPSEVPLGVARAYYKPDIHKSGMLQKTGVLAHIPGELINLEERGVERSGRILTSCPFCGNRPSWASIEIETSKDAPDHVQAYAAGMLEGSLCWQMIYWHWENTIHSTCLSEPELCVKVRKYLAKDLEQTRNQAKQQQNEPFWHHVHLFYEQLDGLKQGWKFGVERSRKKKELEIPPEDFLWLNSVNEIRDLKMKYIPDEYMTQYTSLTFFKYLPNTTHHYLMAHETGRSYSEMLRMHKKYSFALHKTSDPNSELIPVPTITFTSYPGAIHSQDDYYQVYVDDGGHYSIVGTNIKLGSEFLERLDESKLHVGPRVAAAARLSKNAAQWADHLTKNGGPYIGGKQWLVLDSTSRNISIWIVEQVPGQAMASDVTKNIKNKGYWISAGKAHFHEIEEIVKNGNLTDPYVEDALKALELSHNNATSPDNLFQIMRKPELISIGRADIIKYQVDPVTPKHGGIIDIKISDKNGDILAIAGPPYSDDVGPFQWSRSILESLPHLGQPDLWNYGPVTQSWVW